MTIIGISGKISSGKDTVGKIIQFLTTNDEEMLKWFEEEPEKALNKWEGNFDNLGNWKIKKFASKLKQIASLLTGIPIEKFEDQEFKKTYLELEWSTIKPKPGKRQDGLFPKNSEMQIVPMTVRELLQKLGTEAMRDGLHTNVWVNALFADYKTFGKTFKDVSPVTGVVTFDTVGIYPNWIITDMRFPNEMEAVKEKNGITIRVVRPDMNSLQSMIPAHASETALDGATFDYEIINDGTIEDLIEKVKEILIKENII